MASPQIKICGITDIETARHCAELGVDAIGLVFFAKSPRNVSMEQAEEISRSVSGALQTVGLFVDESYDTVMRNVERCGLTAVQLHGVETPGMVTRLMANHLRVVKALFQTREPLFESAAAFDAHGYVLECGKGRLPGGNAETWNWRAALDVARQHPVVLAGGLDPDNVASAIAQAAPDAVDVSSGVESEPGVKAHEKIGMFVETVRAVDIPRPPRRIF
jgi:phosphoribosylanthranilate isomerase